VSKVLLLSSSGSRWDYDQNVWSKFELHSRVSTLIDQLKQNTGKKRFRRDLITVNILSKLCINKKANCCLGQCQNCNRRTVTDNKLIPAAPCATGLIQRIREISSKSSYFGVEMFLLYSTGTPWDHDVPNHKRPRK
jgi:hypothetical protein